ncbi:MAG: hypothetical protein IPK76_26930 [Lewinellaceae bacterium]|nr:hypothetical protein [Lewinellaceae bacterium]
MRFRIGGVFPNCHIHEFQTIVVVGIEVIRQPHVVNGFGWQGGRVFCIGFDDFVVGLLFDERF